MLISKWHHQILKLSKLDECKLKTNLLREYFNYSHHRNSTEFPKVMIHFINWKYHKMWEIQSKAVNKYMTMILSKISIVQFSSVAQSCLTLCDPMDCCLPGSSVHGVFQTRVLEWVGISFSRGSSWPRNQTCISCIVGRHTLIKI